MYKEFYNIKTDPFSTLPIPAIFYDSGTHQEAWEYLAQGISYRDPFLLVTGDHGTGKTLLCLKLIQELRQKKICPCAYIPVPAYSYAYLLKEIASQLDISVTETDDAAIQYAIFQHLKYQSKGSAIYIVLDDVHVMELSTLKKLLLLANFNYHEIFPVKFAFFAHTSFLEQLAISDLIDLDYRIKKHFHLSCLDLHETKEYIYFRLLKAEAPGIPVFAENAIKEIFSYSNGIPQLINKICDACLVLGAAQKSKIIEAPLVADAKKAIDIGYREKTTESKVALVQESQSLPSFSDTYRRETENTGDDINKKVLNTIRNLTAILIFALIILFSALTVMSYLQYRFIASLKNISCEVKPVTQPAPSREPPQVSTVTVSEDKPLINKLPETHESSSIAPLPDTTSIKNTSMELTTSVQKDENTTIPAEHEQQTTSIYPEHKADEASTTISETTTSTLPAKTTSYPFTIQLACYNSLEGAKERITLFKKMGLSPYLIRSLSRVTGELFWVICTGYYKTMEEAESSKQTYELKEAIVIKTPYANLVGVYAKPEEMAEMINRLERSEHFPYVIADNNNVYRLYVGAFATKQGAENMNNQLRTMGINAVIEER